MGGRSERMSVWARESRRFDVALVSVVRFCVASFGFNVPPWSSEVDGGFWDPSRDVLREGEFEYGNPFSASFTAVGMAGGLSRPVAILVIVLQIQ